MQEPLAGDSAITTFVLPMDFRNSRMLPDCQHGWRRRNVDDDIVGLEDDAFIADGGPDLLLERLQRLECHLARSSSLRPVIHVGRQRPWRRQGQQSWWRQC